MMTQIPAVASNTSADDNLISGWDWANKHVQPRNHVTETRFVNGATVLISAGPPRLAAGTASQADKQAAMGSASITGNLKGSFSNIVFPIGVCQGANIQQNRGLQRIFEIGSDRSYFIQGRSTGGVTLNRVLFNGANILRVLYAYYHTKGIDALKNKDVQDAAGSMNDADDKAMLKVAEGVISGGLEKYTGIPEEDFENNMIKMNPGYNNLYINLASDLFHHPMGLLFTFQDNSKATFASFYMEMCYVVAHQLGIQGQAGSLVAETVQMEFDRIMPVQIT